MTERPTLRSDSARTRDRLLDAAGDLLSEKGPAFSLPDLARASGVATATVYRHFDDIHEVHREYYYRLIDQLVDGIEAVGGSGPDRFGQVNDRWVTLVLRWGRGTTHIRSPEGFLQRVRAGDPPTSALNRCLAPIVEDLIAGGTIQRQDADYAVLLWITIFDERVIIDLRSALGWSAERITTTLSTSLLAAWRGR